MGDTIRDPMNDAPPRRLTERVVYAQANKLATFRLPGDRKRSEASRWFASTQHAVRPGNEAKYLIDGSEVFQEMAAAIRTATNKDEHFVYMLAWTMFIDCPLAAGASLRQLFQETANRGVQVRAMVWEGWGLVLEPSTSPWGGMMMPMGGVGPFGAAPAVNARAANPTNDQAVKFINGLSTGQAVLDSRHLNYGAHHQKILVVNGDQGLIAFVGGVDVNPDRIFPCGVNGSGQPGAPMHDVHCRLRGPIAKDVLQTFIDRWSDFASAQHVTEKAPLVGLRTAAVDQPARGKLSAQLALTFGNTTKNGGTAPPYKFAPNGETTAMQMFTKAIAAAKRFIYIEDQYLVNPDASAALLQAIGQIQHLTILIPHSSLCDLPGVWDLRKKFIEPLVKADSRKVNVYVRSPYGKTVAHSYVHAKTWIFDDQFAIIGSANCNLRGWTHDSESCVGIYDESRDLPPAYTFAHRLRIRLWAEHLNMDTPEGHALLADGVTSCIRWSGAGTKVEPYDPRSGSDGTTSGAVPKSAADPDGR